MRSPLRTILLVLALALGGGALAACGADEEDEHHVVEGEILELDELSYRVQITRFLALDDAEDRNFRRGLPDPPIGEEYLATFMQVTNDSDEVQTIPADMHLVDTRGNEFQPIETENEFALPLGAEIPPDSVVPAPNTPAASGPIGGAFVLFLIDENAPENRPLELEIPGPHGQVGKIELDL
jgi:hypothetical protein